MHIFHANSHAHAPREANTPYKALWVVALHIFAVGVVFRTCDSCVTPRTHLTDAGYISARVWLVALLGQGAHMLWYWGRGGDGTPTAQLPISYGAAKQFPESVLTQPILMDAYHRTWQQIQSHADGVAALATTRRFIWLVISHTSYLASGKHARAIYNAVEALTFLGIPFGFIAGDGDGTIDGMASTLAALPLGATLLLPGVTHIEQSSANAIAKWAAERHASASASRLGASPLLALGEEPGETLAFDAATGRRVAPESSAAHTRAGAHFLSLRSPESLLAELERHLLPPLAPSQQRPSYDVPHGSRDDDEWRPLLCEDADSSLSRAAAGVYCRAAALPGGGGGGC